ncbi:MAG TPA: GNAT family N-acetyltransferase [Xanthomonadaceae bacterium]|nr:GNAT family N-acetyltransferase [Xanthomonadaceae bacterium]
MASAPPHDPIGTGVEQRGVERSGVRVRPVTPALLAAVAALRVTAAQQAQVGEVAVHLAQAAQDPCSEPMAILAGDTVVGFYRLDFAARAIAGRHFGSASVTLRPFLIDARWQGRGLGRRALQALLDDLRARHPRRRLLLLTVAVGNRAALALYRRAGFVDSGVLLAGGRGGPQHLLLRALGGMGECAPWTTTAAAS